MKHFLNAEKYVLMVTKFREYLDYLASAYIDEYLLSCFGLLVFFAQRDLSYFFQRTKYYIYRIFRPITRT